MLYKIMFAKGLIYSLRTFIFTEPSKSTWKLIWKSGVKLFIVVVEASEFELIKQNGSCRCVKKKKMPLKK